MQTLVDPIPEPLPPSRSELAAAERAASVEALKDKWNDEVSRAVHWVQNTDWDEVRDSLEDQAGSVWARITGQAPSESVDRAQSDIENAAQKASNKAQEKAGGIRDATRGAFDSARSTGRSVEEAAQSKALEARLKTKKVASDVEADVEEKASEAKGTWGSLFGFGKEKAVELADKAKTAVGLAESKVQKALDGKTFQTGMSPVERALHERYDKTPVKDARTVADVLKERYVPFDKRDNTILRGL